MKFGKTLFFSGLLLFLFLGSSSFSVGSQEILRGRFIDVWTQKDFDKVKELLESHLGLDAINLSIKLDDDVATEYVKDGIVPYLSTDDYWPNPE